MPPQWFGSMRIRGSCLDVRLGVSFRGIGLFSWLPDTVSSDPVLGCSRGSWVLAGRGWPRPSCSWRVSPRFCAVAVPPYAACPRFVFSGVPGLAQCVAPVPALDETVLRDVG